MDLKTHLIFRIRLIELQKLTFSRCTIFTQQQPYNCLVACTSKLETYTFDLWLRKCTLQGLLSVSEAQCLHVSSLDVCHFLNGSSLNESKAKVNRIREEDVVEETQRVNKKKERQRRVSK